MVGSLPDALFQVGDNLVLFVDFRGGLVRHVPYTLGLSRWVKARPVYLVNEKRDAIKRLEMDR